MNGRATDIINHVVTSFSYSRGLNYTTIRLPWTSFIQPSVAPKIIVSELWLKNLKRVAADFTASDDMLCIVSLLRHMDRVPTPTQSVWIAMTWPETVKLSKYTKVCRICIWLVDYLDSYIMTSALTWLPTYSFPTADRSIARTKALINPSHLG